MDGDDDNIRGAVRKAKSYGTYEDLGKQEREAAMQQEGNGRIGGERNHLTSTTEVYGDEGRRVMRDRTSGYVEFILDEGGDDAVTLSQFRQTPNQTNVYYRKVTSKYKRDCTPEEAGFVLPPEKQLGQWFATSISGNDITSSVIYTSGLVAAVAGFYTPICLLLVVLLLYFFRTVYVELVTALPLNGGTYTGILNTTRKGVAVIAACLSFLAYAATAVVSATSGMEYLKRGIWHELNTVAGTIIVISAFAILMLIGLRESAVVAFIIFSLHILTLSVLVCAGLGYLIQSKGQTLVDHYTGLRPSDPLRAIVLGFAQSMLGITGFETSANFVEHQRPGVFAKTLRNMWFFVAFFNPITCVLGFATIPPDVMYLNGTLTVSNDTLNSFLSVMAGCAPMNNFTGGHFWLQKFVVIDSVIVLSGAVLTAYVGILGLIKRMVDDDIFPTILLAKTPITGTFYPIILFFCCICISLIILTWGDISSMGGVYTVSFLSVMLLFCIANLLLKHTRRDIRRDVKAKWWVVLICMSGVVIALVGNCVHQPVIIAYTALYFSIFMAIFYGFYARTFLIRYFLRITRRHIRWGFMNKLHRYFTNALLNMEDLPVVFFSRRLNLREMNRAVQRVLENEISRRLKVVHLYESVNEIPESLKYALRLLDQYMYPNIRIDVLLVRGRFGPGAVRLVEALLDVPPNRMFIVCPSTEFQYNVAQLGSVRIIMSRKEREGQDNDAEVGQNVSGDYSVNNSTIQHELSDADLSSVADSYARQVSEHDLRSSRTRLLSVATKGRKGK